LKKQNAIEDVEPVESEVAETDADEEEQEWEHRAPEFEREDLTRYAGEYTPVEMENMDENHSNLLFYTIGGSFRERANAERLYRNFQEQGYEAHILYQPNTSFYFVAYEGFENLEQAINFTRQIQRDVQSEAWLSTIIMEERLEWNN
jgi:general secretion pathway protein D